MNADWGFTGSTPFGNELNTLGFCPTGYLDEKCINDDKHSLIIFLKYVNNKLNSHGPKIVWTGGPAHH